MTPQERGVLVHKVFEEFFASWQAAGHGAVTAANMGEAVEAFREIAERRLDELPEGDRALERTFLLGSAAAPGLAERAFAFEIEDAVGVVERLLEYRAEGDVHLRNRRHHTRRTDPRDGGSHRPARRRDHARHRLQVVRRPTASARCSSPSTGGRPTGARWPSRTVLDAGARRSHFGAQHEGAFVTSAARSRLGRCRRPGAAAGRDRRHRGGEFPPRPVYPFLCTCCPYPAVCRKDYVGDE